jgi:UDP-N-acetylmuramoyl-tripeptide--D-alanyl-D-alanine ligase
MTGYGIIPVFFWCIFMYIKHLLSLGTFSCPISPSVQKVAVDSRLVQEGDIFFALPGDRTDGHLFLADVKQKKAAGAVISKSFQGVIPENFPVMRIENPLKTLQEVARMCVGWARGTIFALTGSVGKTTTKEFIHTIVSQEKQVFATSGTQNSQIGMCRALLNGLQGSEDVLVMEMGMTLPGHIRALTSIATPDIALVTTVCHVHAENFASLKNIAEAKAEIFENNKTKLCLYNADIDHSEVFASTGKGEKRTFSMKQKKAFWSMDVLEDALFVYENGSKIKLPKPKFPAIHVYENLLAAIAGSRSLNVSWDGIQKAIPHLKLYERRLEQKTLRGIHFINDSYNACEKSLVAALGVLEERQTMRKIAVIGQMGELGHFSKECHENVGKKALDVADSLYCLGQECFPMVELWEKEGRKVFWTLSLDELIERLDKDLRKEDCVLVKGSRSNALWKVVEHFSQ